MPKSKQYNKQYKEDKKSQKEEEDREKKEEDREQEEEEDREQEEEEGREQEEEDDDSLETPLFLKRYRKQIYPLFALDENEYNQMMNYTDFKSSYSDIIYVNNLFFSYKYDQKFSSSLHDTNHNFVSKYKIFYKNFKHGEPDYKKFANVSSYATVYPKKQFVSEYPDLFKRLLFEIKNEATDKYYWYLYLIPHKLLQIFSYIFSHHKDKIKSILIDIKNYFFLILRCGGINPFKEYLVKNILHGKNANNYTIKKKENLAKSAKKKKRSKK